MTPEEWLEDIGQWSEQERIVYALIDDLVNTTMAFHGSHMGRGLHKGASIAHCPGRRCRKNMQTRDRAAQLMDQLAEARRAEWRTFELSEDQALRVGLE
jgi:hypothetical protein